MTVEHHLIYHSHHAVMWGFPGNVMTIIVRVHAACQVERLAGFPPCSRATTASAATASSSCSRPPRPHLYHGCRSITICPAAGIAGVAGPRRGAARDGECGCAIGFATPAAGAPLGVAAGSRCLCAIDARSGATLRLIGSSASPRTECRVATSRRSISTLGFRLTQRACRRALYRAACRGRLWTSVGGYQARPAGSDAEAARMAVAAGAAGSVGRLRQDTRRLG